MTVLRNYTTLHSIIVRLLVCYFSVISFYIGFLNQMKKINAESIFHIIIRNDSVIFSSCQTEIRINLYSEGDVDLQTILERYKCIPRGNLPLHLS